MKEKELMLASKMYNPNDEELANDRKLCKNLCFEYNNTKPSEIEKRKEIIDKILGSHKNSFLIEQNFWCDYGYNIEIGKNFYSNHNLVILDCAKVSFGDNVFIGPNCSFYTANHPIDATERNKYLENAFPITVGSDVWFGGNVCVLPNVNIGNNVVIGAGSVVVKDIPSNCVAIGNPCKPIKNI